MKILKRMVLVFIPIFIIYGLIMSLASTNLLDKIKTGLYLGGYIGFLSMISLLPSILSFKTKYFTSMLLANILIWGLNILNNKFFNMIILSYICNILNPILIVIACRLVFYDQICFKENELMNKIANKMFLLNIGANLLLNGLLALIFVFIYLLIKNSPSILQIIFLLIYFALGTLINIYVFRNVMQKIIFDTIIKLENISVNRFWWWFTWRLLLLYTVISIFTVIINNAFTDSYYVSITKIIDSILYVYSYYMFFKLAFLNKHEKFVVVESKNL